MAKAKKLPSGNWRVQASVVVNGQNYRRSFTADTAKRAEHAADEWRTHLKMIGEDNTKMTVKEAMEDYCTINQNRLSPTTHAGYKKIIRVGMPDLIDKPLYKLTCPMIQASISESQKTISAKTISNRYSFLRTILSIYYPSFVWSVKFPKIKKKKKRVFSDLYIRKIFRALKGSEIELEAYLGMLSMRASEIGGLKKTDIDLKSKCLEVRHTKLQDYENNYLIVDSTKTELSERTIYLPDYVCYLVKQRIKSADGEFISTINPSNYCKRLQRLLEKNNIEKITFHQLRHLYSSISSKLGIDAEIRKANGGWSSETIMDGNYRHPMSEAQEDANKKMNNYVEGLSEYKIHTKFHTDNRKRLKLVRFNNVV